MKLGFRTGLRRTWPGLLAMAVGLAVALLAAWPTRHPTVFPRIGAAAAPALAPAAAAQSTPAEDEPEDTAVADEAWEHTSASNSDPRALLHVQGPAMVVKVTRPRPRARTARYHAR